MCERARFVCRGLIPIRGEGGSGGGSDRGGLIGLDSLGWHSGQGSMVLEITKDIRSRKKISGNAAQICALKFGTVLAVIVI